jgi:hypothetical protein
MQTIQHNELYTDIAMTATTVLKDAQRARIADHLRHNAEDVVFYTNPPTIEDCRIVGAMLDWAFNPAPVRIPATFDY